jgi:hypothetical protein
VSAGTANSASAALGYLYTRAAANRLMAQLRRLRSPRYLVALVAGASYFWIFLFRPAQQGGAASVIGEGTAQTVVALVLALLVGKWWVVGADERALAFTPAEVQFLFAAPITRRQLVHVRLMRTQLLVLMNVVIWTVVLRGQGLDLSSWRRALALWVLFSTLHLHRLGAALATASAIKHGAAGRRRQLLALALFAAAVLGVAWGVASAWPALERAWSFGAGALAHALLRTLDAPSSTVVMWPFRALVEPSLALDALGWGRAMLPAVALLALHYLWVLRTDVAFEEAAVEASRRRLGTRDARGDTRKDRRGAREASRADDAAPVTRQTRWTPPLAPTGAPLVAIVWKNAVALLRSGQLVRQLVLFSALALAALAVAARNERAAALASGMATVWGGLLLVFGPMWIRFDLRQDLPQLAVLRALPLSGREIVAAQVASSATALTVLQVALLVAAYLVTAGLPTVTIDEGLVLGRAERGLLLLGAVIALPAVNAASLFIQNAAALLFPGWVRLGSAQRGVEALGQNLLSTTGALVVLAFVLALPAAAALIVAELTRPALGPWWTIPVAAAVGAAATLVELGPMLTWLGRVFERTDPGSVPAA